MYYLSFYSISKLTNSICMFALISKNKHVMAECQASVAGGLRSGVFDQVGSNVCSEGEGVNVKATFKESNSRPTMNLVDDKSI